MLKLLNANRLPYAISGAFALHEHTGIWRDEAVAIQQAGLASRDWQATDQTATRVDGQNETCHVLGNPFFTVYHTRPGGTRQDVLAGGEASLLQ